MAKLPLVGESYGLRSPAAACQQTLNLFPQFIDDPNEKAKNIGILRDIPGYHKILDIPGTLRGLWSCGGPPSSGHATGRLFVAGDLAGVTYVYEVSLGTYVGGNPSTGAGSVLSTNVLLGSTPDGNPVQFFGNGNQMLIVANGYAYIWNPPTAPILARLQISGDVTTADGTTMTWVDGDYFTPAMTGTPVLVNQSWQIATYVSATTFTVPVSVGIPPPAEPNYAWSAAAGDALTAVTGAYLDTFFIVQRPAGPSPAVGTVDTSGDTAIWVSGDQFTPNMTSITIGTGLYTCTYVSPTKLTLGAPAGHVANVPYTATSGADLGRQFNISAAGDGTNWDPLDFATKEGYSDYIRSILADHEQLYLFGFEEMEVWQNTGAPTFPFQRIPGAASRDGSAARNAPTALAEKVFYLGGSPRGGPCAYRLDNFVPAPVSTHAVEATWAASGDQISGAVAYPELIDGHNCWVINFPGSLHTWVYDETASQQAGTPIWHQRAKWTGTGLVFTSYLPKYHTFVQEWGPSGMHVVGAGAGTGIYESNLAYTDLDGSPTAWVRTLPYLYAGGRRQYFNRMTLEMDTGETPGAAPVITRDYSDDRGHTFINPVTATAGTSGQYGVRVVWPVNGSSQGRAFRFSGSGLAPTTLIDLDLDVTVGVN
jgi:hypothetical protein